MQPLADQHAADVLGTRLTYRRIEPPHDGRPGPTLVFLHEGLGSVTQWRDVPDQIVARTGLPAIVYNRRGHGTSDRLDGPRPVSFMHDEALTVLPALLEALCIERPLLVGHSDGASIALIFAGAHPNAVTGLVLEAPHVFVEDLSVASIARIKTVYDTTDLPERLARHHGANADTMFRGWNDVWLDPAFRAWNIESSLRSIACPVLVIQGDNDEYGTMNQVRAIATQVAGRCATHRFADCGHSPHLDQREAAVAMVAAFVNGLSHTWPRADSSAVARPEPVE